MAACTSDKVGAGKVGEVKTRKATSTRVAAKPVTLSASSVALGSWPMNRRIGDARPESPAGIESDSRGDLLQAKICDGKLVMSIGVSLLCSAVLDGSHLVQLLGNDDTQITDEQAFSEAIRQELLALEDDGCNLIQKALDRAAENAVEKRCQGISVKADLFT